MSKTYDKGCEKGCEEGSRFPLVGKRRTEAHYVKHNESREKRERETDGGVSRKARNERELTESAKRARRARLS